MVLTIYQHDREYPIQPTRNEVLICNSKTRVEEVGLYSMYYILYVYFFKLQPAINYHGFVLKAGIRNLCLYIQCGNR